MYLGQSRITYNSRNWEIAIDTIFINYQGLLVVFVRYNRRKKDKYLNMNNPTRSPSIQDGMINALGLATNVGGSVADVDVKGPVAPINNGSDEEVCKV